MQQLSAAHQRAVKEGVIIMIVLKENTVVWNLLRIIALCGEFPVYSIGILGNRREYRKRIAEMQLEQTYKNPYTGQKMTVRALTIASYGKTKSVRILKNAADLLKWIGYYEPYAERFLRKRFPGNEGHLDRNHRVAETAALFLRAGFSVESAYNADLKQREKAVFYLPHVFKRFEDEPGPDPKTQYTRITGAFASPECGYAVYNTRDRAMVWTGKGELKSMLLLRERFNRDLDGAILLGKDYETGMRAALNPDSAESVIPFCQMYRKLFFVPLDGNGVDLLQLITKKDVSERVLEMMFNPASRSYQKGTFNYHAMIGGVYVYSFLDSDVRGLNEFRKGMCPADRNEILCYDFQADFIKQFFRETGIKITVIPFEAVRNNLK